MLVFFGLGNAKVLSFALANAKLPDASSFASQWNIGLVVLNNLFHIKKTVFVWYEHYLMFKNKMIQDIDPSVRSFIHTESVLFIWQRRFDKLLSNTNTFFFSSSVF